MALVAPRVRTWLSTVLTGDATLLALGSPPLSQNLRIYPDVAPQGAAFPLVLYAMLSGVPHRLVGPDALWTEGIWLIRAATGGTRRATPSELEPIANRIDALLHGASGTVTNGTIYECLAEDEHADEGALPGGGRVWYLGRRWRIRARAT